MAQRTATFTTEFRHEIEAEQSRWLRRRFLWYCGVVGGLTLLSAVIHLITLIVSFVAQTPMINRMSEALQICDGSLALAAFTWAFLKVRRTALPRAQIIRLVSVLILAYGMLSIIRVPLTFEIVGTEKMLEAAAEVQRLRAGHKLEKSAESTPTEQAAATAGDEASGEPDATTEQSQESASTASVAQGDTASGDESKPSKRVLTVEQLEAQAVSAGGLMAIGITHLFACLFLPLTPRESWRPVWPLLLMSGAVTLYYVPTLWIAITFVVCSPLVVLPGLGICWWRQSRFKDRFTTMMVKSRYTELKQELTSARQIHESLFPRPILDGPVRFTFRYEPMRSIGGDYLYARTAGTPEQPVLHVVILDVTGHGITAALTVNRLHGEIDRQFGVNPNLTPGELLVGLNSYLHHTLAIHSVYATALCMRIDSSNNTVTWASAGHPPAFVRGVDGTVQRLDPTTLVLGACRGDDFQPCEESAHFGRGDVLIAYTDGAIEARNDQGKMLMLAGMERLVAALRDEHTPARARCGVACEVVLHGVDMHRFGPLQDDTLIVEVARGL